MDTERGRSRPPQQRDAIRDLIGATLHQRRWRLADLARATGMNPPTLSKIYNRKGQPSPDSLRLLAPWVGVSVEHLMELAGHLVPAGVAAPATSARELLTQALARVIELEEEVRVLRATTVVVRPDTAMQRIPIETPTPQPIITQRIPVYGVRDLAALVRLIHDHDSGEHVPQRVEIIWAVDLDAPLGHAFGAVVEGDWLLPYVPAAETVLVLVGAPWGPGNLVIAEVDGQHRPGFIVADGDRFVLTDHDGAAPVPLSRVRVKAVVRLAINPIAGPQTVPVPPPLESPDHAG